MGVIVEAREDHHVVVVLTPRGFQTWLVTEDARTLLEDVNVED